MCVHVCLQTVCVCGGGWGVGVSMACVDVLCCMLYNYGVCCVVWCMRCGAVNVCVIVTILFS